MQILEQIRAQAMQVWKEAGLMQEMIEVVAAPLSVEEAIGRPEGDDFPIQKGKEKLMEARFKGAKGQAFTDTYGHYRGTLAQITALDLKDPKSRAVFVATLNALMHYLGQAQGTIHCHDQGPVDCAQKLTSYIQEHYGQPKIGMVGYQPAMIGVLSKEFTLRVLDLDPDNIGQIKHGALIEDGEADHDLLNWADILLVTGTTLANGTLDQFLTATPVIFYGTTIAGAAALMGWERFCPCSQ